MRGLQLEAPSSSNWHTRRAKELRRRRGRIWRTTNARRLPPRCRCEQFWAARCVGGKRSQGFWAAIGGEASSSSRIPAWKSRIVRMVDSARVLSVNGGIVTAGEWQTTDRPIRRATRAPSCRGEDSRRQWARSPKIMPNAGQCDWPSWTLVGVYTSKRKRRKKNSYHGFARPGNQLALQSTLERQSLLQNPAERA